MRERRKVAAVIRQRASKRRRSERAEDDHRHRANHTLRTNHRFRANHTSPPPTIQPHHPTPAGVSTLKRKKGRQP
ncbi:hypothetical protein AAur_1644 [Paenarthrobacter aurescens TC1]|uniref:Uncharacterized protein n=1 Tax=Paenarthrobacter aurescens (strain TC1) TaxID=290340 RepID=A1R598_PAEAT|nr:hypothetical protein AAur_1644 [Paenarthrobacter aurescens TC1]